MTGDKSDDITNKKTTRQGQVQGQVHEASNGWLLDVCLSFLV